jgi:E3 ubiquitin-protein ligase HERC2
MSEMIRLIVTCDMFEAGRDASGMSAGQRFMTDLLVSSLMADGGLEFAMEEAIKKEKETFEEKKV